MRDNPVHLMAPNDSYFVYMTEKTEEEVKSKMVTIAYITPDCYPRNMDLTPQEAIDLGEKISHLGYQILHNESALLENKKLGNK